MTLESYVLLLIFHCKFPSNDKKIKNKKIKEKTLISTMLTMSKNCWVDFNK